MAQDFDVVVVGGGNAAAAAALSARETGASVVMFERAPEGERGGNSHFTGGGFRFPYADRDDLVDNIPGLAYDSDDIEVYPYTEENFFDDLGRVTHYRTDPDLAEVMVTNAREAVIWLGSKGVKFTWHAASNANLIDGKRWIKKGGNPVRVSGEGAGLVEFEMAAIAEAGIPIEYNARVIDLITDGGTVVGVRVQNAEGVREVYAKSVILASGGFEANDEWRARYLGPNWELARVRGTRYNTGDGHDMALKIGARPFGHWSGCHAVAWDGNAPMVNDRKKGNNLARNGFETSLMVNEDCQRFVDEGKDMHNFTYAALGREILKQPDVKAYQLFDQKSFAHTRPSYSYPEASRVTANTIEELAEKLDLDPVALRATIDEYNAAVQPGDFNPSKKDGKRTTGLAIDKTNWALTFDEPPFYGLPVTTGITFTYGGIRINTSAQVLDWADKPIKGLFAAGEIVGGIFYHNYPSGSGLIAGTVFGRIAGRSAVA
jgi:tricarballylate dehydrogenase